VHRKEASGLLLNSSVMKFKSYPREARRERRVKNRDDMNAKKGYD
jgi:hypothetical protein